RLRKVNAAKCCQVSEFGLRMIVQVSNDVLNPLRLQIEGEESIRRLCGKDLGFEFFLDYVDDFLLNSIIHGYSIPYLFNKALYSGESLRLSDSVSARC